MRVILLITFVLGFLFSHAQSSGPEAYLKGKYIQLGISGAGGYEGANVTLSQSLQPIINVQLEHILVLLPIRN